MDIRAIVLSWLKGESSDVEGERVALFTYGDVAYLGAFESPKFVRRYHVEGGKIVPSSLRDAPPNEREFAKACGAVVKELCAAGTFRNRPCPAYDGAAALYQLA